MAKSKEKQGGKNGNILQKYAKAKGKGKFGVSAMKTGVEGVLAASAGAGVGALMGQWATGVGLVGLLVGEYFGDETNLSKAASIGMIGYGIGAMQHSKSTAKSINGAGLQGMGAIKEGAKQRLMNFKDNWMKAFFLDKLMGSNNEPTDDSQMDDGSMGAIDMSEFDVFDELNQQEAYNYEEENGMPDEYLLESGQEEGDEEGIPIQEDQFDQLNVQEIDALDGHEYEYDEVDFSTF